MTHSRKREFKTRRKKLFRNILNEKGPTIEACRKPVIIIPLEQQLFLTFTLCCRLSKQLCNLRRLILVRLRFAGFAFFKKIPRKFISKKFVIFSYPKKKKKKKIQGKFLSKSYSVISSLNKLILLFNSLNCW